MNKTEFKALIMQAVLQALMNLSANGMLPIGIRPTVCMMEQDEVSVDLIMEENNRGTFWVKITL